MEKFRERILRLRELYFEKRGKILSYGVISVILICFCICSYIIFISNEDNIKNEEVSINVSEDLVKEEKEETVELDTFFVDIKGAVKTPGVYKVGMDAKVIDVIDQAGGLNKNANTRFINLSKRVNDGDVIVIYTNEEIEEAKKNDIIYVDVPCVCEEVNSACIENNVESPSDTVVNNDNSNAAVNINTASVEELMNLVGIGEVKAKAIVEYRESNGKFDRIEDILKVSGISETIFDKIKEDITV